MANPSLIHSIPTEQYNQDMVSLGLHSALTAMDMTEILHDATALLLISLCQAIDLRGGSTSLGRGNKKIYETIRSQVEFMAEDRPLDSDVVRVKEMIKVRFIKVPEEQDER
jgi:phenylalanine ammonia-lyase